MFDYDAYVRLDDGTYILYQDYYESLWNESFADIVSIDEDGGVCE